jgi:hypothetical protein
MATRKYIGTSINSQQKKNRKRSSARKTPRIPESTQRRLKWKKPTRCVIPFHEAITAMMPRKIVSSISGRLRPSTPRWNAIPAEGIHSQRISSSQRPPASELVQRAYSPQSPMARMRSIPRAHSAIQRASSGLMRPPIPASNPPSTGTAIIQSRVIGRE